MIADQPLTEREALDELRRVDVEYQAALARREHGGVAQDHAYRAMLSILDRVPASAASPTGETPTERYRRNYEEIAGEPYPVPDPDPLTVECRDCGGSGKSGSMYDVEHFSDCNTCNGSGRVAAAQAQVGEQR